MNYRQMIIEQTIQQTEASEHLVEEAFEKIFERDKKIFGAYLESGDRDIKEANQKFDAWYDNLEEGWLQDTMYDVISAIEQNSLYEEHFCELFGKED